MKKRWSAMILAALLMLAFAAHADFVLPGALSSIEAEAFMNDATLGGVLCLPDRVERVGEDAFSQTNLFALVIPANTESVGQQSLKHAAYVRVVGNSTVLSGLSGVHYVIGPENSPAEAWAGGASVPFVPETQLVEADGLYYQQTGTGLILLSAKDNAKVGRKVSVPGQVGEKPVTGLSPFAFCGCQNLQTIELPESLFGDENIRPAMHDCQGARVTFRADGPVVRSVSANMASGTVGDSITWTVEAASDCPIQTYFYTLQKDGQTVDTLQSNAATYTQTARSVGAYTLNVEITDAEGKTGLGSSSELYIAVEAMTMIMPETLVNGEDLEIQVQEAADALRYSVYLTNETTGEYIGYRTLTSPGKVTFDGYRLDEGTWRVSGYVYGNNYRYSVPTVRRVVITGMKQSGPEIAQQDPIMLGTQNDHIWLRLSETEPFAVKCQFRPGDGSVIQESTWESEGDDCYIYPEGDYESWQNGGSLLLQGAFRQDGVWTDWGPVREVTVQGQPKLETPVLTVPDTAEAGKDLTVSFSGVEHGNWYNLYLTEGYDPEEDEWYPDEEEERYPFFEQYQRGGTAVIPGYYLSAGTYTVRMCVWGDEPYSGSGWACRKLEITGERPAAPKVKTDKREQKVSGDTLTLEIQAPGAEGAYILCESWRNGRRWGGRWSPDSISLDEEGKGTCRKSWSFGNEEEYIGQTFRYQVTAMVNGIWSDLSEPVDVLMIESHPLPAPEVNVPGSLPAGSDLTFTFSEAEGAEWYGASLRRVYGDEYIASWSRDACLPGQEMTVPGYQLTAGSYRLIINAYSQEEGSSETERILSVTGSRPEAPSVSGCPDEVHVRDHLTFSVDTSDAQQLAVRYRRVDANGSNYGWDRTILSAAGETTPWSVKIAENAVDAVYTFQFSVKRGESWSAWRTFERTVQALPPLEPVQIHAKESFEAGEDVIFTYDPVEHADTYAWYVDSGKARLNAGNETSPAAHTIYGYELEEGTHRIHITAQSDSYGSSQSEFVFHVTGAKGTLPDPSVDKTEVIGYETYTFTIDTSRAEELVYRLLSPDNIVWSSQEINVLEATTHWSTYNGNQGGGTRLYSFAARINDRWTAWSTPISVTAMKEEQLEPASLDVPTSLPLGRDLSVTVGAVENADWTYVYLYNSRGAQVAYRSISGSEGGSVTFEGYLLSAGTFTVQAIASRSNARSEAQSSLTVTAGERPDAPLVLPDADVGHVYVSYGFTLGTAGADLAAVRYYRDGYTNDVGTTSFMTAGETTRWQDQKSTAGEIWKYAFAVRVNGIWSPWSSLNPVEITNRDVLEKPVLHVPDSLEAGSDLYLSFSGVEHADSYSMRLRAPGGKENSWTASADTERRVMGYDLVPGTYTVSVTASGAGYESSTSVQSLVISGSRWEAADVQAQPQEVFTNETYTFSIDTQGAEEVAYRYTYGTSSSSSGTLNVLSDRTIWDTSASSAGIWTYSFCVLREGRWSQWSTGIPITVKARPQLPEPEVDAPKTLQSGRNLTVTVGEVDGATEYDVDVYNNRNQRIAGIFRRTAGDFLFQGYCLPAGSLQIRVSVYGPAGSGRTVTRNVAVSAAQQPESPEVIGPEQTTIPAQTYYYFTIPTDGASMAAVRYYRIGNPNDLSTQAFSVSETESTTSWRGYQYSGGSTYAYSFAVLRDGVWSEWSSFKEITIE